ncbi:alpha/beta hydrolase [Lichenicola sp.]|uniref:alpha/beta hydrolase n=1 Tax=Lichenicola sp. TaxID=2804529 RepID=UPI003B00952C
MTRQSFLFVHGWGFDAGVWDAVRRLLPEARTSVVELGYLGGRPCDLRDVSVPEGTVAVGHSGGVLDLLLDLPVACRGLVAINGFTRFAAAQDFPEGAPVRVLDRMVKRLAIDPAATVASFQARCGIDVRGPDRERYSDLDAGRLTAGLVRLRDGDARGAPATFGLPVMALAAADDPVVPAALTSACFDRASIVWSDAPGHVLPLSRPDWCADRLRAFAAT